LPWPAITQGLVIGASVMVGSFAGKAVVQRMSLPAFHHLLDALLGRFRPLAAVGCLRPLTSREGRADDPGAANSSFTRRKREGNLRTPPARPGFENGRVAAWGPGSGPFQETMDPNSLPSRATTHLAASAAIVARCLRLPRVSIAATRYMVIETARQWAEGNARPDVAATVPRARGATGCRIVELAICARFWASAPPPPKAA
jgi:hypothetical protein